MTGRRTYCCIKRNEWASCACFISIHCLDVHDNGSSHVGRRRETLSLGHAETHALLENDGHEVGNGVGIRRGQHVQRRKGPDFAVSKVAHVRTQVEGLGEGVGAVVLDARDDICCLYFCEKLP